MSDIVLYDRQGTVNGNTSATFKELKKLIKSEKNISGDITIEKIGISEISNGKFKVHVKYESDGKLMEIDLPFENCKDLLYVYIPSSVTTIGEDAFSGCDNVYLDYQNE